ncbi:MAG: enoyl-CoA hydratase/isomerase family protein [Pirellulales bacterium]|nr:enoyl-CoA hydratase/isomerase family protein [Pirellulales bacterium]
MSMPGGFIEVKVVDYAGTIVMNRPDHKNRLTRQMIEQLSIALDDLYREKKVRAIILTGAGDVFCEGIDFNELHETNNLATGTKTAQQQWGDDAANIRDLFVKLLEITKPVIASVNGPALSAGAGLVAACDIVVAADNARFGIPDPQFGLVAGVVAPLVCHRIASGQAARLLLTGMSLEASEAQQHGLFHELLDSSKVWARAMELAQTCATGAPESIQLTKRLLNETVGEHLHTQLSAGAVMQATSCTTEAAREGVAAHLEQRPPQWK